MWWNLSSERVESGSPLLDIGVLVEGSAAGEGLAVG
jgi:hypothetical protein